MKDLEGVLLKLLEFFKLFDEDIQSLFLGPSSLPYDL